MNEWIPHLEELRRRIIAVLVLWAAATALSFYFSDYIIDFLLNPVSNDKVSLYSFSPSEKFTTHLNVAVWTGIIWTIPFLLFQTGLFIWPALRKNERGKTLATLFIIPVLFCSGAAFAYYFLSPAVFRFFLNFGLSDVKNLWSFREYISLLYSMMIAAGLLLESPLILFIAFSIGIVSPHGVARARPAIVVLIFLASALCTPPDVVSQVALGIPLYLLFELTLFLGRLVYRP